MYRTIITCFLLIIHLLIDSQCMATILSANVPGDVQIGAMLKIWDSSSFKCSSISEGSVRSYEAIKWTINVLNEMDYVPGIKIGLTTRATCRAEGEAVKAAMEFIMRANKDQMDANYTGIPIIGLVGPEYSSEAEDTSRLISSLDQKNHLLQVVSSATASSLSDSMTYRNLRRVIPNDKVQVRAMIPFLHQLNWNYFAVIYDNDVYGKGGFQELSSRIKETNMCIAESFPVNLGHLGEISFTEIKEIIRKIITHAESSISGVIVFGSSKTANAVLLALEAEKRNLAFQMTVIFSEATGLNQKVFQSGNQDIDTAKGSFNIIPPLVPVDDFIQHWKKILTNQSYMSDEWITNPWIPDVIQYFTGCRPTKPTSCALMTSEQVDKVVSTSIHDYYTVLATVVQATSLKRLQEKSCLSSGFCDALKAKLYKDKSTVLLETDNARFTSDEELMHSFPFFEIDFEKDEVDVSEKENVSSYELYQYRKCISSSRSEFCFVQVGNYSAAEAFLETELIYDYTQDTGGTRWPNVNIPQCSEGSVCRSCINSKLPDEVLFIDGDVFVVGTLPVYDSDAGNPVKCSNIRTTIGMQIGLAMMTAVDLIMHRNSSVVAELFPNKKIGLVLVNTCNQPLLCESKVMSILQGNLKLTNGSSVDISRKILGFVSSLASSVSMTCADVLTRFGYVQISYASTTKQLSDRDQFPFFLRTPTPDDKQALTMLKIIEEFEANYIQVLHSKGAYGEGGYAVLASEAKKRKICIANHFEVDETNYRKVVDTLRKNAFAKIVVIFVQSYMLEPLMNEIYERMDEKEFMFLFSESIGTREDLLVRRTKLEGMMSLSLEMNYSTGFQSNPTDHFISLQESNPWIRTYLENKFQCYLSGGFDKSFRKKCSSFRDMLEKSLKETELWSPFASNAMIALLEGASSAFAKLCGSHSESLCDDYRKNPHTVYEEIKKQKVNFDGSNSAKRLFDNNGDGNVGYKIYQAQRRQTDRQIMDFVPVGRATLDDNGFGLYKQLIHVEGEWRDSKCPNEQACSDCFQDTEPLKEDTLTLQCRDHTPALAALGVLVGVSVIIITLLVFLLLRTRAQRRDNEVGKDKTEKKTGDAFYDNGYLVVL